MTKSDKLKIAAVIVYMLNPLGILAFGSQPTKKAQNPELASMLARHKFQSPQVLAKSITKNAAAHQKASFQSGRSPASAGSKDYSCMKHLKE